MSEYLNKITAILSDIENGQSTALNAAAERVAQTIISDGLIFTFGCGHSHLIGLDAFYRAGGLAIVSPMLDTDLMLHNGAAKSSRMEKISGIGGEIFRRYVPRPNDMIFVFSASGKNAVPIEVLQSAKAKGVYSVGVSSLEYVPYGGKLHNFCDLHIDCKVPYGDACIDVGDFKMGGLSTVAACFILNTVLIDGAKRALKQGTTPPIYLSGNIGGGRAHNEILENIYMARVKHL